MSGEVWALVAGAGFGVFQSLNRRAVIGMDVYLATFLQLLISAVILAVASLVSVDPSLLRSASIGALINFALAGLLHFFVGWTLLNVSQKRIGAARTSPLTGTMPLFGAFIAAVTLGEFPDAFAWAAIVLIVGGVYIVSDRSEPAQKSIGSSRLSLGFVANRLSGSEFGLAAALCWSISPIFIREGLKELPSPLFGVTVGMIASVVAYGVPLVWRRRQSGGLPASTDALVFKLAAGVLVGLSTWARWIALDLTAVAPVLALSQVSVPVVILLAPLVSGKQREQVAPALWIGSASIVAGALLLILRS
ncbi:MAG TPA: EamA family transporter [Anaerolineae bacterium]|nr:EamA family transporter [Anaerolineae bacterium]